MITFNHRDHAPFSWTSQRKEGAAFASALSFVRSPADLKVRLYRYHSIWRTRARSDIVNGIVLRCAAVILLSLPARAAAQDLTVSKHDQPPPGELGVEIKTLMASGGATARIGSTSLDFWFVVQLPVQGTPNDWSVVEEGTVVGAMRVSGHYADIRGRVMKPGVYTLRYGIQPQDGDHLGVSPYREFLLVSPAAADTKAAPSGHEGTVELAKHTTGISHPAVLSIDPPMAKQDVLQVHKTEADYKAAIFEIPTNGNKPLRFGLILVGKIEA